MELAIVAVFILAPLSILASDENSAKYVDAMDSYSSTTHSSEDINESSPSKLNDSEDVEVSRTASDNSAASAPGISVWCSVAAECTRSNKYVSVCGYDDTYGLALFEDICHMFGVNCYLNYRILVLLSVLYKSEAQKPDSIAKKCYKAKTCVHNNHEKCGMNRDHEKRRFLDSCDIEEFNCLYDKDYKKTSMSNCNDLPSLYASDGKARDNDGEKPPQNDREKLKLEIENNPNNLYLGHNSIEFADSALPAEPENLDVPENDELRDGKMKMGDYNRTKTLRGTILNETMIHGKKSKKPFNVSKIPVKMAKLVKYKTTMEDKTLRQRRK